MTDDEVIDRDAFTRFEREGWERIPDGYHRFMGPVTAPVAGPLLDAAAVGPGTRLLDVATGPGYVAAAAAARGAIVAAVDLAPAMVEWVRAALPRADVRVADAHALPHDDHSFDAVVAGFLLPHLADHERAMREAVRVLATGGRLAVSTWDVLERVPLIGAVVAAAAEVGASSPGVPAGPPFFRYSEDAALRALLTGAGLREVSVRTFGFEHRVATPDELWDGVLGGSVRTAALVRGQDDVTRRRIRSSFDRIVGAYATDDGLVLPVSVKVAAGTR